MHEALVTKRRCELEAGTDHEATMQTSSTTPTDILDTNTNTSTHTQTHTHTHTHKDTS